MLYNDNHDPRVELPESLIKYLDRVGAIILNFRKAVIIEKEGKYNNEKCYITIKDDGTIECDDEQYEIRPSEQEHIRQDFKKVNFPRWNEAQENDALDFAQLLEKKISGSIVYKFYNRTTGRIVMLQHCYVDLNFDKQYVPWTFWSDNEWRRMEPDRKLPFWKPKVTHSNKIMVHEGAKAAVAAEQIINDPTVDHPWKEKLKEYEHWGMIGGALAGPYRSEYLEINKENPEEVVYVADNDYPGNKALHAFSKQYGRKLIGIEFSSRKFPKSFDIADQMPEDMFDTDTGVYKHRSPRLEELMVPATRATKVVSTGQRGRPNVVLREDFEKDWYHSVTPELIMNRDFPYRTYTAEEFNSFIRPFSDAKDTVDKLRAVSYNRGIELTYDPTLGSGIDHKDGRVYLNTYTPSRIEPIPYTDSSEIQPWFDFMEHLVPNERDRNNLMKWIVTLVSRPDIKMLFGCLMISEAQGVGKDTLGEKILAELVGLPNCSFPTEANIVDSGFNDWLGNKRLAIVHEIYAGHSSKAYDRLKSYITDKHIDINKKYQNPYRVTNWTHMYVMSNSENALKLSSNDRRWFVPQVTSRKYPVQANDKNPREWWKDFYKWLETGGLGKIRYWCDQQLNEGGVGHFWEYDEAPGSDAKDSVIFEAMSKGEKAVYETLTELKAYMLEHNRVAATTDGDIKRAIEEIIYDGVTSNRYIEKTSTLRKVAKAAGCTINPEKVKSRTWGHIQCRDHRVVLFGMDAALYENMSFPTLMQIVPEPIDFTEALKKKKRGERF